MDYRRIDEAAKDKLHIDPVELEVRRLDSEALMGVLNGFASGDEIASLIKKGVTKPDGEAQWEDEYGGASSSVVPLKDTWTLALLTALKPAGREMQSGWIRRLLRTALPLGDTMSVVFNGESLTSTKVEAEVETEWILGEGIGIESIGLIADAAGTTADLSVTEFSTPYPHVRIEGVEGDITGKIRLYKSKISGGKSDALGSSNGFFVNIKGRVVNLDDPYFGLENLSHSAWSKFRATVRCDRLDEMLAVNREELSRNQELRIFRAFLRHLFNKARVAHDALAQAAWPHAGEVLTGSWNAVPLEPLGRIVLEGIDSVSGVPDFIDTSGVTDTETVFHEWEQLIVQSPGDLVSEVEFEALLPDAPLVKYDLAGRRVVINSNHPFSLEYGETHEQQLLLRDTALVDLLSEAYMADIGIDENQLRETREYRDQLFRLIAQVNRRSGAQIVAMLLGTTNQDKPFEYIVGDALSYLGFAVQRLGEGGKSGEPEGLATAPMPPEHTPPSKDDHITSYKFTYDAKSAKGGKSKTSNLTIAGLTRHRRAHEADHILVVAPDYEMGALQEECKNNGVTPMRARDLAELLMLTATAGPLDLQEFREVLYLRDPNEVHEWVSQLSEQIRSIGRVSLDLLIKVLDEIGYEGRNAIHVSVITDHIGQHVGSKSQLKEKDVRGVVAGLAILVPSLVRITRDGYVFLSTSPEKLRAAIRGQISALPEEYRVGFDEVLNTTSTPSTG
jgi:hypothetical protein